MSYNVKNCVILFLIVIFMFDFCFALISNRVRTRADVLEHLQRENDTSMRESFRAYQLHMNGQAGLHILEAKFNEAAEIYRALLFEIRKEKDTIEPDDLQQIHVLVNFKWLLTAHGHAIEGNSE